MSSGGGKKKKKNKTKTSYQEITKTGVTSDSSFANFLAYSQQQEKAAADRAAEERAQFAAEQKARQEAGQSGYAGLKSSTQQLLSQGVLDYQGAVNQLRDYAARYNLAPPEADVNELTQQYTAALPGKRAAQIESVYEETLGRKATAEELSKAQERFTQGVYGSAADFRESLTKSPEYLKKFNQSYLDNYYDTQFGKQTVDAEGEKTGKRTFKFDSRLLPKYAEGLEERTKVVTPDFGEEFTGTPGELEEQIQNVRDTRQYLYSAGLTNLQGEIDKETQKLKNEGSKEVAKISRESAVYSNLVSGFWG